VNKYSLKNKLDKRGVESKMEKMEKYKEKTRKKIS